MAGDVLPHHNRVVHQPAQRQGEPAQGEDVEGLAGEVEEDQRRGHRQRQADADDEQVPEVRQEHQDHHERQERAGEGLMREALNRRANVARLVKRDAQRHPLGQPGQARHRGAQRVYHLDDVGAGLARHRHGDPGLAVHLHDLRLVRGAILHGGDVGDVDRHAVPGRQHDPPDGGDVLECRRHHQLKVDVRVAEAAGRDQRVVPAHRGVDVLQAESGGGHAVRVDVDVELPHQPTADKCLRHAWQSLQLRLNGVGGELVEHPGIHPRGRDHDLGHGDVGDVELQDRRLADAVGQAAGDALDVLDDLDLGDVEVRAPIKPHLHHTAPAA